MTETLQVDEAGRLMLSEAALQAMGLGPGKSLRANVTARGIEILDERETPVPAFEATQVENGLLVLAPTGIEADIPAAIRAGRDELAGRALPR